LRRILGIVLSVALLAAPALGLDACAPGPEAGVRSAASCCGPGCTCTAAGCGDDPSLGSCPGDHTGSTAGPDAATLTGAPAGAPRAQLVAVAVAHPAAPAVEASAAGAVAAREHGSPTTPTTPCPAFQLFCTLLI
jgi:hypothetical protein